MIDGLTLLLLTVAGLAVGSFLNVCISRLPRRESVAWPPSHCTACQRPLDWFENVPVVSWLVLRGRCRTCGSRIGAIYPLVELCTAAVFVAAFLVYGWTPLLAVRILFACALIVLFAIDLEHQILPNPITLGGAAAGLAFSLVLPPGWERAVLGLLIGGLFPFTVAWIYAVLRGREGMGMGDFKMLAMVGAFLGWPLVWVTMLVACLLGIVVGGSALLVARRDLATRLPFGTFIAVAALLSTLAGDAVQRTYDAAVNGYLGWMGLR